MDAVIEYKGQKAKFLDLDADDHIDSYLARGVWYEEEVLKFIQSLQIEGNYLDVGAYIGNHSIFFSLFCSAAAVYSIEPQVKAYNKMMANFDANDIDGYLAFNCALSDELGTGKFDSKTTGNSGMAVQVGGSEVEIVTLDSLHLDVKMMKVDVEGMEMNVLRGSEKTLESVDHLFVEIPPKFSAQDEIIKFLMPKKLGLCHVFPEEQIYYFKRAS